MAITRLRPQALHHNTQKNNKEIKKPQKFFNLFDFRNTL